MMRQRGMTDLTINLLVMSAVIYIALARSEMDQ